MFIKRTLPLLDTTVGTITLDKETVIAPTGITMELPPESCSLVFNDDDKIVKAVGGGIVMDRTVGNSRGLAGMSVQLTLSPMEVTGKVIRRPPLIRIVPVTLSFRYLWDRRCLGATREPLPILPASEGHRRFLWERPQVQQGEVTGLPPFPRGRHDRWVGVQSIDASACIQFEVPFYFILSYRLLCPPPAIGLARGMLASDFGASDPGLLAKDFMFVGPVVGPLKKASLGFHCYCQSPYQKLDLLFITHQ